MILIYGLAVFIGVLLGLLGGGGSILTVPVLVYLAEITPKSAIITSLIVVGTTSLIATINHARKGRVCWKTGALFGSAGMLGAFMGGRLTVFFSDALLLVLLGVVMLVASFSMIRGKQRTANTSEQTDNTPICPLELPILAVLLDGFFLGILTGLVGVGGGFLLVPALTHLASLPVHAAIGTSLFIIFLQSIAALMGHAQHLSFDPTLTSLFTICTIIGSYFGAKAVNYLPANILRRSFGFFVLILGGGLLYKEVNADTIAQIQTLLNDYQQFIVGASCAIAVTFIYRMWVWLHTKKSRI